MEEDPLIRRIKQTVVDNNTRSLEEFIGSETKESVNVDDQTFNCLFNIVHSHTNKLTGIRCVLSCLKYFYEQNLDQSVWDKFAQEFVGLCSVCLNEYLSCFNKTEDDSVLVYLGKVYSELVKQSKLIVRGFHYVMVKPIIKILTTGKCSFNAKYALAETLLSIAKHTDTDNHRKMNLRMKKDIAQFTDFIFVCGNYEIQKVILEILLLFLTGIKDIPQFCDKWFCSYPQVKADLLNRITCGNDFNVESREILNSLNKFNKNQLIFSIGCICVFLNGIQLKKPNDPSYVIFWIDFNVCSESILIYHETNQDMWEMLHLYKSDILEVSTTSSEHILNNQMAHIVKLSLILSNTSGVEIWFELCELFTNLEKSFLIPVFGSMYESNWESSLSRGMLTNTGLSQRVHTVNKYFLRTFSPLSVSAKSYFAAESEPLPTRNKSSQKSKVQSNSVPIVYSDDSSADEGAHLPTVDKTSRYNQSSQKSKESNSISIVYSDDNSADEGAHLPTVDKTSHYNQSSQKSKESNSVSIVYSDDNSADEGAHLPTVDKTSHYNQSSQKNKVQSNSVSIVYSDDSCSADEIMSSLQENEIGLNKSQVKSACLNLEYPSYQKEGNHKVNNTDEIKRKPGTSTARTGSLQPNRPNKVEINKSDLSASRKPEISFLENSTKSKDDTAKRKTHLHSPVLTRLSKRKKSLYSPANDAQCNLNSPLYDCSGNYAGEDESLKATAPVDRGSTTNRIYKETTRKYEDNTPYFENEIEFSSAHSVHRNITNSGNSKVQIVNNKKFFKSKHSDDSTKKLTETPCASTSTNGCKSVYSDFSSSSERLKSVKKTYAKRRNLKKRQKKFKTTLRVVSEFESDFTPEKRISKTKTKQTNNRPTSSFVSRLETKLDPLRARDKEESDFEDIDIPGKNVKKPKVIGKSLFTDQDPEKTNSFQEEGLVGSVPYVSSDGQSTATVKNDDIHTSRKERNEKPKQQGKPTCKQNDYTLQSEDGFYSNHEEQDMEMVTVLDSAVCTNDVEFGLSRETKPAPLLKEDNLSKFGSVVFKKFSKSIEEMESVLKCERQSMYSNFLSDMEAHERNASLISVELEKCRASLLKTVETCELSNQHFQKIKLNFSKAILELEMKQSLIMAKCLKDMRKEIKDTTTTCTEEGN